MTLEQYGCGFSVTAAEALQGDVQIGRHPAVGGCQIVNIGSLGKSACSDDPVAQAGEFQADAVLEKGIADMRKRVGKQEVLSDMNERRDRDKRLPRWSRAVRGE